MAYPVQTQRFVGLAGDHEDMNVIALPDIYSSANSQNVRFDKLGQVRKIAGYAKQNTAYTTDTGGSATKVVGMAPYRHFSGGTTTRKLIAVFDDATNEYEIAVSTDLGATFTLLEDLGSSPVGNIPDFAQMGNDLFITDGVTAPRVFNNTTSAAAGGTQSPTPTLTAASATGSPKGTYECKLLSVIGKTRQLGSVVSSAVALDGVKGSVSWTADSNTNVTGYEVYFTTGTGKEFYFAGYVDGRTTTSFTYNLTDPNLQQNRTMDEHGDAPPVGARYVEPHKQRMFWGGTDANPRRAYYSSPGDADSVGLTKFINFDDATSGTDQITGMTGNFNDYLIVWQEYSVWRVGGSGLIVNNITDWDRERTNASVGTVSHRSVVKVPNGAVYTTESGQTGSVSGGLVYYTPFNGIHIFDGDSDVDISGPKRDFLSGVQFQYRHLIWAEHDETNEEITWYVPHGSSQTIVNKSVTWNYRFGTWSEGTQAPFGHGCTMEDTNDAQVLLTGSSDVSTGGLVYKNKTGTSYDGTGNDIQADWWTKPLVGMDENGNPAIDKLKRWRRVNIITVAQASALNLTTSWYKDFANSGASAIGTAASSMAETNATHGKDKVLLKSSAGDYMHSTAITLRFGDDADDAAWGIAAFTLGYQVLPGEKRG